MSMGGVHAQRDSGARIACPFLDGKSNAYLKSSLKPLRKLTEQYENKDLVNELKKFKQLYEESEEEI